MLNMAPPAPQAPRRPPVTWSESESELGRKARPAASFLFLRLYLALRLVILTLLSEIPRLPLAFIEEVQHGVIKLTEQTKVI